MLYYHCIKTIKRHKLSIDKLPIKKNVNHLLSVKWYATGDINYIKWYMKHHECDKDLGLINASCNGDLEIIKYLVSLGADIHADNDSAIAYTSRNGHLEVVKYLISVGEDIHVENNYAITYASENGHLEVIKNLVSIGAKYQTDDAYAIRWASRNVHLEVVRYY